MSGANRQKEQQNSFNGNRASQANSNQRGRLVSFNPTDTQKALIKADERPIETVLAGFETLLQDGHVLTLKYQERYDSYSLIVREASENWLDAVSLSVWHNSFERCLRIMDYALREVYPDFPLGIVVPKYSDTDW